VIASLIVSRDANNGLYKPCARVMISLSNISNLSDVVNLTFVRFGDLVGLVLFFPYQLILYHEIVVLSSLLVRCSVVQVLKVLGQNCGVLKVVGVGLQLVCFMVLKP